jgi:glycolate oxidase iron-sulfur subunit
MLFTGCVQSVVDGQTLDDAIEVLTAAGYRVGVPREQDCCGALPAHAGDPATAARLAAVNRGAFRAGDEPVVCLATGCAEQLLKSDPNLKARVVAIEALLVPRLDRLATGPLPGLALLHRPCTQPPDVGGRSPTRDMLGAIPELTVQELPGNERCCGAAGDHPIRYPAQADALAAPKVAAAMQAEARWLATTNIGCMLHLGRALAHDPEVLHPVSLLARSLRSGSCRTGRDMAK